MRLSNLSGVVTLALTLPFLTFSCKEDTATPSTEGEGDFRVEMTDAPIDDGYVKAVVVTVADIRVDGESLEGFNKSTVEVSALFDGETELLYSGQLAAKNYNKIELVLDDGAKAVDNGPGCYYINHDNQKKALQVANDGVIAIQQSNFSLVQDGAVNAVIDFDLRKAFVRTEDESEPYALAASTRLNKSLRFVEKARTGMLTGTVKNESDAEGEVVVYAYKQGTYTSAEAQAERDDDMFLNAVSSSKLNANNEYTLAFLEAGAYELIAVSYKDNDSDGDLDIEAQFEVSATGGLDLGLLQVKAESTTTADFQISFLAG